MCSVKGSPSFYTATLIPGTTSWPLANTTFIFCLFQIPAPRGPCLPSSPGFLAKLLQKSQHAALAHSPNSQLMDSFDHIPHKNNEIGLFLFLYLWKRLKQKKIDGQTYTEIHTWVGTLELYPGQPSWCLSVPQSQVSAFTTSPKSCNCMLTHWVLSVCWHTGYRETPALSGFNSRAWQSASQMSICSLVPVVDVEYTPQVGKP